MAMLIGPPRASRTPSPTLPTRGRVHIDPEALVGVGGRSLGAECQDAR